MWICGDINIIECECGTELKMELGSKSMTIEPCPTCMKTNYNKGVDDTTTNYEINESEKEMRRSECLK